jgi:membrane protein DedA with SNARE-associated domain
MIRLWGLLALIIIVIAVVDVWQREHSMEKRLLWTVVIIVFPFVGALAWYLVSRKIINL